MLAVTPGTHAKLTKVYTGTGKECRAALDHWKRIYSPFPGAEVVELTRGNNRIGYWRPCCGRYLNEKIYMLHWSNDGTVSLYL